jgi:hypothetical protein
VPRVPLAQTTRSFTTDRPRNEAVVSAFNSSHVWAWPANGEENTKTAAKWLAYHEIRRFVMLLNLGEEQ